MVSNLRLVLVMCFSVSTLGCVGTETGNPVKPTLDASRIELVVRDTGFEVVGQPGAVSEEAEVASFEVWSSEPPLRSYTLPSEGFAFEFVAAAPPFRVFAENAAGRSEPVVLGDEIVLENAACFSYIGSFEYELEQIEGAPEAIEILSLPFVNECQMPATLGGGRLRLQSPGLSVVVPETPTPAGAQAELRIVAEPTVSEFDDILLIGNRNVGSIAFRGRIER